MLSRLFALLSVIGITTPLSANTIGLDMGRTSKEYSLLAYNKKKSAAVIRVVMHGFEGGGSISYVIADLDKKKYHLFIASNDFSPGNGSTPEQVSPKECVKDAAAMNRVLKKLGFTSRFHTTCNDNRSDLFNATNEESSPESPEEAQAILTTLNVK